MDWLPTLELHHLWDLILQTPVPSPTATPTPSVPTTAPEVELLRRQLEFLKDSNTRLSDSFSKFVGGIQLIFTVFSILFGVVAGLAVYLFGKNLSETKDLIRQSVDQASQQIRRDAETQITDLVRLEVDSLRRTLRRERVISSTLVDYYLPDASHLPGTNIEPDEVQFLRTRGFQQVRFSDELQKLRQLPGDVVVLDLENWVDRVGQKFSTLPPAEQEAKAAEQIDALLDILPNSTVVVVFIRGIIKYIYTIKNRYVVPANSSVTLVGNVADAAYVVAGSQQQ
jgi:hypothetical protein